MEGTKNKENKHAEKTDEKEKDKEKGQQPKDKDKKEEQELVSEIYILFTYVPTDVKVARGVILP